jgi:hypothetical protein
VSDNSVGNAAVSSVLCQYEAAPVHRRVVESPLDSEPAANLAFASPLVLVPL